MIRLQVYTLIIFSTLPLYGADGLKKDGFGSAPDIPGLTRSAPSSPHPETPHLTPPREVTTPLPGTARADGAVVRPLTLSGDAPLPPIHTTAAGAGDDDSSKAAALIPMTPPPPPSTAATAAAFARAYAGDTSGLPTPPALPPVPPSVIAMGEGHESYQFAQLYLAALNAQTGASLAITTDTAPTAAASIATATAAGPATATTSAAAPGIAVTTSPPEQKIFDDQAAAAMKALAESAEPLTNTDTGQHSAVTGLTALTSVLSVPLIYWVYNPEHTADTITRAIRGQKRFVPLALATPSIISGIKDTLSSAATPLVCLTVLGIGWWQLKKLILEPEKLKRKQLKDDFDRKLKEQENKLAADLAKIAAANKADIAKSFAEHITENQKRLDAMSRQIASAAREVEQLRHNVTENHTQIDTDFQQLKTTIAATLTSLQSNIATIQTQLNAASTTNTDLSATNIELKRRITELQTKVTETLATYQTLTSKLGNEIAKQGTIINANAKGLEQLRDATAAALAMKKDVKAKKGFFK